MPPAVQRLSGVEARPMTQAAMASSAYDEAIVTSSVYRRAVDR
jgi:hypothetical protein